jgi:alkanesulfonate monooxygenase SsuD/methylene tetrahydromethanopterin reductase-like flavin-dependent oxidoreductase (luciferase family)
MKFGLLLNTQAPLEDDVGHLFERLLDQVAAARDAGFDLVLAPQHYLADYAQLQPIPLLSRIAAEAGSMRVGTGILILPLHHPVELAEHLSTLEVLSSGVVAGVGAGYRDVEFDTFGIPKAERGGRIREGVELMNRLWTEEDVTYDGEFFSTDGVTINPRPAEKPPVWVGANSRTAVERAARVGDAWYINPHSTIDEIRDHK